MHPELYDGCKVTIAAYLLYAYPDARLFISREDRDAGGVFFGPMGLSFQKHKKPIDYELLRNTARRGYIILTGRVSTVGPYGALIDEIEEYRLVLSDGK